MSYQDQVFRDREKRLLDTALSLLQEQGWEQITVAQVAAAAGIGKGTVYKHFESKEHLFARLVLDYSWHCLEVYRQVSAGASPLDRMRRIIRRAFTLMTEHRTLLQLCVHCERPEFQQRLSPEQAEQFQRLDQAYYDLFLQVLGDAVSAGEVPPSSPEILFMGMDATFHGVIQRIIRNRFDGPGPVDPQTYFDQVTEFLIAGIRGAPGRSPDSSTALSPGA